MNAEERFIQWWGVARQKGKSVYALQGALIFTVLFAIFKELAYWGLFERQHYAFQPIKVIIGFVVTLLLMYFYNRWQWNKNETRYTRFNK